MAEVRLWAEQASVVAAWSLEGADFVLEVAEDLGGGPMIDWGQVSSQYQTNATHISVTLPLTASNKFYRLHKP